ncbi:hypothetical protein KC19_4G197600 [Ceratodon purpureus]|uniref:Uncharacterized protein n=1 Tax=Ceratodon purpureus TaxID=3225 RepID=A0A8T0IAP4_CERPU|nr:hypothetical protein KC19_4G197600 [Ceratodon purpureus]
MRLWSSWVQFISSMYCDRRSLPTETTKLVYTEQFREETKMGCQSCSLPIALHNSCPNPRGSPQAVPPLQGSHISRVLGCTRGQPPRPLNCIVVGCYLSSLWVRVE